MVLPDRGSGFHSIERYCAGKARFGCAFACKAVLETCTGNIRILTAGVHQHTTDFHASNPKKTQSGKWGIAPHLHSFIQGKVVEGVSAKKILRKMRAADMQMLPSAKQLSNFVTNSRKLLLSELPEDNLASLFEWLQSNQ
jgi:hypothetical protein